MTTGRLHRGRLAPFLATALLLATFALGGCATAADSMALIPAPPADYQLGAGDQLRVIVFGETGVSGEVRVADSGQIALPLAGSIRAAGRTPVQLTSDIVAFLKSSGLYRDPKVSVEILAYRPVFVLGEVAKPGQYPYQPGMTALTAVAVAGGFTYRAVTDRFSVVRVLPARTVEGRALRETPLAPSDVLTVYERVF